MSFLSLGHNNETKSIPFLLFLACGKLTSTCDNARPSAGQCCVRRWLVPSNRSPPPPGLSSPDSHRSPAYDTMHTRRVRNDCYTSATGGALLATKAPTPPIFLGEKKQQIKKKWIVKSVHGTHLTARYCSSDEVFLVKPFLTRITLLFDPGAVCSGLATTQNPRQMGPNPPSNDGLIKPWPANHVFILGNQLADPLYHIGLWATTRSQ